MLQKVVLDEKEIQLDTIGRLLEMERILANANPNRQTEKIEENCILDTAAINLENSKIINSLVRDMYEFIQGGKNEMVK